MHVTCKPNIKSYFRDHDFDQLIQMGCFALSQQLADDHSYFVSSLACQDVLGWLTNEQKSN